MEVKVSEILPDGMTVEFVEDPEDVVDLGGDIRLLGPVKAKFRLRKTGVTVFLAGEVQARLELECSRCGKHYALETSTAFDLDLDPVESLGGEEEKELQADDLEVEFYRDDTVDLSALAREQVLLQVPMKPLCTEGCRGLCQFCGQDLNEGQCGCEAPAGHPGLAGLKDFFKDKK